MLEMLSVVAIVIVVVIIVVRKMFKSRTTFIITGECPPTPPKRNETLIIQSKKID
jgi:hypothetical protein